MARKKLIDQKKYQEKLTEAALELQITGFDTTKVSKKTKKNLQHELKRLNISLDQYVEQQKTNIKIPKISNIKIPKPTDILRILNPSLRVEKHLKTMLSKYLNINTQEELEEFFEGADMNRFINLYETMMDQDKRDILYEDDDSDDDSDLAFEDNFDPNIYKKNLKKLINEVKGAY